jgi:putative MATE family efflux protein
MNLLNSDLKRTYLKYLSAAFGSALVSSIYGVVDMVMVGQYHGPSGSAAMAVISPIWNIIYSFGLLGGIGGSVLLSNCRGKGESKDKQNEYFTAALILTIIFAAIIWAVLILFEEPMLTLFGASETLMPLCKKYLYPVCFSVPVFLFTQMLSAFLRNDGAPGLATKAVMCGGLINVFGDYFLVFTCNLGIMGAAIATVGSASLSLIVMLTHFRNPECTLHLVKPSNFISKIRSIITTGFSTFFIDIAMGFITILFNQQIMKYLGEDALSVYGIIVNISTFVQCCAYGVGQASQPILSVNFGAGKKDRVQLLVHYCMITITIISTIWLILVMFFPNGFVRLFMTPTDSVLAIAPAIMRTYAISFALLPFNIYATYYFQSTLQPMVSFTVSLLRGAVISGSMIMLLPILFGSSALWFAMPIAELVTAVYVVVRMKKTSLKIAQQ